VKNRKAFSLITKGIYLIIAIVLIAIFINRIFSFNALSSEDAATMDMSSSAMADLNTLAGNEKCLALRGETVIENIPKELSLNSIIDFQKLNTFTINFSDIEPDCAIDYKFGYRVRVETLPIDINSEEYQIQHGGVYGEVLSLINGKNITFLMDSSGSMRELAGPKSKIECVKDFMRAFVSDLRNGSGVEIFAYGTGHCGIDDLSNGLVILNGNRDQLNQSIDNMYPQDDTPLGEALEAGFIFSKANRVHTIVLLTDGCQWDCANDSAAYAVDIAQKYKSERIVVHTIGFGDTACIEPLKKIAQITGGQFFDARLCEELIPTKPKEPISVQIAPQVWEFGSLNFSKNNALKKKLTTSIPISIYFDESTILPAKISITMVDGDMERFLNGIEKACSTGKQNQFSMFFSYSTYSEGDSICMSFPSGKSCQKIACEIPVEFSGIKNPGTYKINIQPSPNLIKVIV
jgi:hypothetical protein